MNSSKVETRCCKIDGTEMYCFKFGRIEKHGK